ncbi:hypothetical protein JCM10213_000706 [Rhodosporidiobolus nylandii]
MTIVPFSSLPPTTPSPSALPSAPSRLNPSSLPSSDPCHSLDLLTPANMLDRLPVELLQHILRLAAPLDYTPELYKERRATLKSCCFVSRRIRVVAQPMLLEVFQVKTDEDVEAMETDGRGPQVKLLVCDGGHWSCELENQTARLHRALGACPLVRDLRLFDADLKMELLAPLSELRRVVFVDCWVDLTDAEITLPKLEELSMNATAMDSVELGVLLRRCCLPALQSLAVTGLEPSDGAAFSSALSSGFFENVQLMVLSANDLARLPPSFPVPVPSRVLLATSLFPAPDDFTPSFKPTHLALYPSATLEGVLAEPGLPAPLRAFLPVLSQHSSLRNLGIPDCLHPSQTLPSELASARDELLKACTKHEVNIVWTAELTKWDSLVPPEFRAVLAEEAELKGTGTARGMGEEL